MKLTNEFAHVELRLVGDEGREQVEVRDMRTGRVIRMDALELECLAWAEHEDLAFLLDPSATRWPNAIDG